MNTTAHVSYAFLIYTGILQLVWHAAPNSVMCFLILLAGMAPDFDGIYHALAKKGDASGQDFQHHLYYWTHWPSSYLPLLVAFLISLLLNFYPEYFLIAVVGPYSHMLFDSISCGDGMMWGMSIWRRKQGKFARYVNLDSRKVDGYHGGYWSARYRHTKYFLLENIAAAVVVVLLTLFATWQGLDPLYLISIIGVVTIVLVTFRGVDPKYSEEPPQGRYADYHVHPEYVAWYRGKYGSAPPKKYDSREE